MDHVLREKFFLALDEEIRMLMDTNTGMVSEEYSRQIDCPLCGQKRDRHEHLFDKNGFTFVRCQDCGLIFTNPQVKSELLPQLYKDSNSNELWVELQKSATEQAWKTDYYLDSVRLIESYCSVSPLRLLDIGCNTGYFLEVCRKHRPEWQTQGIEMNTSACQHAQASGIRVRQKMLSELNTDEQFDIYTLFGVMEHMAEPYGVLNEIKERTLKGAASTVLAIVPNSYSLYHMLLQDKSLSFDGRDHLLYFSENTLREVFERSGFEVLALDTVLDGLGSIKRQMQWYDPNCAEDTDRYLPAGLKKLMQDGTLQSLMYEHNLGLRLRILARYRAAGL